MGRLIYSMNVSLDGYMSDENGGFDWAEPMEDVHTYINELEGKSEVMLLGRRMYETLAVWDDMEAFAKYPEYVQAFQQVWLRERKVVFSTSLKEPRTKNTILKKTLVASEIEALKRETAGDLGIGGADIASQALDMGLVDEIVLFTYPVIIGKGKKWITNKKPARSKLLETRLFENDVLMSRYEVL